jgi:hypothetical protein
VVELFCSENDLDEMKFRQKMFSKLPALLFISRKAVAMHRIA